MFPIQKFVSKLSSFWVMDSVLANKDNQKIYLWVIWYNFKVWISLDFIWKFISLTVSELFSPKVRKYFVLKKSSHLRHGKWKMGLVLTSNHQGVLFAIQVEFSMYCKIYLVILYLWAYIKAKLWTFLHPYIRIKLAEWKKPSFAKVKTSMILVSSTGNQGFIKVPVWSLYYWILNFFYIMNLWF